MSLSVHYVIHRTRETFFRHFQTLQEERKVENTTRCGEVQKTDQRLPVFYVSQSKLRLRKKAKKIVNISSKSDIQTQS